MKQSQIIIIDGTGKVKGYNHNALKKRMEIEMKERDTGGRMLIYDLCEYLGIKRLE